MTQGERPHAVPRLSLLLVIVTRSAEGRDILECRFFQSYNRHIQEKGGTPYADHMSVLQTLINKSEEATQWN